MRKTSFLAALIALVLLTFPVQGIHAQTGRGLDAAIIAQERHTNALMSVPGVVGTAVGLDAGGSPVVKIFTETRGVRGLPSTVDGIPVVLEATGKIYALHHRPGHTGGPGGDNGGSDPTSEFPRPVPIGVSTGHPNITAGTICCRVTRGTSVYALSNNHVYADENRANIGDNVLQPGPYDGGTADDAIGTLSAFQEIWFDGTNNVIDAAIALSSISLLGRSTPSGGYGTPKKTTAQPLVNQKVKKYGRTTSLTRGTVGGINATVNVTYEQGVARFVNQIVIQPGSFSAGGDSGSLVVVDAKNSTDRMPVGLLFAGSPFVTIANPIGAVLDSFGVTIDGE